MRLDSGGWASSCAFVVDLAVVLVSVGGGGGASRHTLGTSIVQFGHLEWEVKVASDSKLAGAGCLYLGAVKPSSVRTNPLAPTADGSSTGWCVPGTQPALNGCKPTCTHAHTHPHARTCAHAPSRTHIYTASHMHTLSHTFTHFSTASHIHTPSRTFTHIREFTPEMPVCPPPRPPCIG
jgi:hypothetical protein